jgi:dihydrofolate reductase
VGWHVDCGQVRSTFDQYRAIRPGRGETRRQEEADAQRDSADGAGLAHSLLAAGVIDEYRLVINPVLAGQGLNIFREFPGPIDLHLTGAQAFGTGAVLHVYDRPQRRDAG